MLTTEPGRIRISDGVGGEITITQNGEISITADNGSVDFGRDGFRGTIRFSELGLFTADTNGNFRVLIPRALNDRSVYVQSELESLLNNPNVTTVKRVYQWKN